MFRYVELTSRDVYTSLLGRLLGALLIAFPYFWYYVLGAPGGGHKILAIVAALFLTVAQTISFLIVMRTLHRLLSYYKPNLKGVLKLALAFICLYLPIFEIKYLISNKDEDIVVPAFIQPKIGNSNSVFVSLMCFMDGLPLMNANKLSNALKDEGYFSVADDDYDPAVTINTNMGGLFMCLIKPTSLYVFKELDCGEKYNIPQDSKWRLENSYDQTTSAIVYEQDFDPFWENEKTLSLDIVNALSELEKYYQTI